MALYDEVMGANKLGVWSYMAMLWEPIHRCVELHDDAIGAYIGVWSYMKMLWEPIHKWVELYDDAMGAYT